VLDDAVEEKDGGEKVRLGMVVCFPSAFQNWYTGSNIGIGHSRKLGRYARGIRENRRRQRRQGMNNKSNTITER
jgi:hypothetical protein